MHSASLENFRDQLVLVVGDYMIDEYIGGDVSRISPEAPVPVLRRKWTKRVLGGAGNVVNNIRALSSRSRALTCIGSDANGDVIVDKLSKIDCDIRFVFRSNSIKTTTKTRVVAQNQQVIRIDEETPDDVPPHFIDFLNNNIDEILSSVTAVIISDYGKGVISDEVSSLIIRNCTARTIPVFTDPKGINWTKYSGSTVCTPNFKEFSEICNSDIKQDDEKTIMELGIKIVEQFQFKHLIITRSEKGMSSISSGFKTDYPVHVKEIVDVSGAGDTVIATLALSYASGYSIPECCHLANKAAAIVISKFGTAVVTIEELNESNHIQPKSKVISCDDLNSICKDLHNSGKTIVFTNGCFDLLHRGHLESLEAAKKMGDILIVGLNSDSSVSRLKGPSRPINLQDDRAYMLQSLS